MTRVARRSKRQRPTSHDNGITFAILGDGPYEEIAAFRDFMGYTTPWYSNAHLDDPTVGVAGRISCYLRWEGKIYLTYWTTGRGDELMSPSFGLLDMTAYGRREEWEDSPEGWPQFPTHSVLRTDEHGAPIGPTRGGRPVPQWTRPASPQTVGRRPAGSRHSEEHARTRRAAVRRGGGGRRVGREVPRGRRVDVERAAERATRRRGRRPRPGPSARRRLW